MRFIPRAKKAIQAIPGRPDYKANRDFRDWMVLPGRKARLDHRAYREIKEAPVFKA